MVIGVLIHEANKYLVSSFFFFARLSFEKRWKERGGDDGVGQKKTSSSLPKVNKHKEEKKTQ